jgi:hypothetical protein
MSTELTSTSPLFQADILSPICLPDRILDSPISTSVAVPSQATVSGTVDDFLDYLGFTSPLVPGAFHHSSLRLDPYLPEESSRSRSLSPLTPLPSPFVADIEVPPAHYPHYPLYPLRIPDHYPLLCPHPRHRQIYPHHCPSCSVHRSTPLLFSLPPHSLKSLFFRPYPDQSTIIQYAP